MFRKFPSIEQFKNCIKEVRDHCEWTNESLPIIKFRGTVKLHGTNAAIGYNVKTGEKFCQSRERIINIYSDNYGFSSFAVGSGELDILIKDILNSFDAKESIYIFGEWAGKGIQKTVAISEFEKSFYIFGIQVDGIWVELPIEYPLDQCERVFFINQFPMFEVDIDFNNPENIQNKLVELTIEVEKNCPVSKMRGISGIGEGIVWLANWNNKRLCFKTKGEKHSNSKVKTIKEIAAVDVEKMNSMNEFVDYTVTENRLNQGLEKLKEMGLDPNDSKSTGDFLRWIVNDITREERDIIIQSQFNFKLLNQKISTKARVWFLNR